MLGKRDDENVRLREQRDQLSAEIQERKQKDFVKYSSAQEYKALWESSTVSYVQLFPRHLSYSSSCSATLVHYGV